MAVKKEERGKVVKQLINGTIFDVRRVPKYGKDLKGNKVIESASYCLFVGKNNVKRGFKSIEEAGIFAVENKSKYNKKEKRFM